MAYEDFLWNNWSRFKTDLLSLIKFSLYQLMHDEYDVFHKMELNHTVNIQMYRQPSQRHSVYKTFPGVYLAPDKTTAVLDKISER